MRIVYKKYLPSEDIPVYDYVRQRKLVKYYTRETMAAVVAAGELFRGIEISPEMPFFYSTGETEMMDFYKEACVVYARRNTVFSSARFMEDVVPSISPLSQFKMMRNMTHCFVSIEYGLKGDNAALMGSVSGLLYSALLSETEGPVLIGAGKLHADGCAESGFAEVFPSELTGHSLLGSPEEAIVFFRNSQINQPCQ